MDASYKIQRGIHVHLIQFFMCPEFWVHIIEILLRFFYSICLLFAGIYGILKKRIRRISVLRGQRAVYAVRCICRQKRS